MKKLLLAVAVSTIAVGSVNAATVYEKDGFTYKLNGDFQIQLRKNIGDDTSEYVDFDDLELKNYVSYDLGNDMKAFGRLDFDFKDHANGKDVNKPIEEAYVGIQYGVTSFSFGKQSFASDEFGVEEAYEAPLDEDQFDAVDTDGDDTFRVDVELDNVYLVASYELEAEDKNGITGEFFDLFASTKIAGLTLAAAYQQHTPLLAADSLDTYGLSAAYDFGIFGLAADYSVTDNGNTDLETTLYNVAATFDVTSTTGVAIGMQNQEEDNSDDVTAWYANVTYKFPTAKNVSVFAEIADTDEDNSDMGFLAGMRVKF
ncbi:porin [Marinobacter halophilus]|uniref:Porin n=1 Tax=Marinobacter halophilus TaxID=1323740 RepID=A0A2T1KF81_9GAMM|nr:porin [Marinobacter halophilus]PSF08720.1 porin [Marinobacter halophilus]GGC63199.1 porin [Marinobacter halophilus]